MAPQFRARFSATGSRPFDIDSGGFQPPRCRLSLISGQTPKFALISGGARLGDSLNIRP